MVAAAFTNARIDELWAALRRRGRKVALIDAIDIHSTLTPHRRHRASPAIDARVVTSLLSEAG